ncbi:hypothetical protein M1466_00385 [Candidatus Dependentiae bacterium]|nr:hypothetical protein [Candidatus Dependentiae bacterium]
MRHLLITIFCIVLLHCSISIQALQVLPAEARHNEPNNHNAVGEYEQVNRRNLELFARNNLQYILNLSPALALLTYRLNVIAYLLYPLLHVRPSEKVTRWLQKQAQQQGLHPTQLTNFFVVDDVDNASLNALMAGTLVASIKQNNRFFIHIFPDFISDYRVLLSSQYNNELEELLQEENHSAMQQAKLKSMALLFANQIHLIHQNIWLNRAANGLIRAIIAGFINRTADQNRIVKYLVVVACLLAAAQEEGVWQQKADEVALQKVSCSPSDYEHFAKRLEREWADSIGNGLHPIYYIFGQKIPGKTYRDWLNNRTYVAKILATINLFSPFAAHTSSPLDRAAAVRQIAEQKRRIAATEKH